MKDFIHKNGITLSCKPTTHTNTANYSCIFATSEGTMGFIFSVGSGVVTEWAKKNGEPTHTAKDKYRPPIEHVLESLAADASLVKKTNSFADWLTELGLESSPDRERMYRQCIDQMKELERVLDPAAFDTLLYRLVQA